MQGESRNEQTAESDQKDRDYSGGSYDYNLKPAKDGDTKRTGDEEICVVIEDETESRQITSSSKRLNGAPSSTVRPRPSLAAGPHNLYESFEKSGVVIPENEIEATRISNNYKVSIAQICVNHFA